VNGANDNLQGTITTPTARNRVINYSYDNAGDLLNDGHNTLTYDGEGRIATSAASSGGTTSYTYDAGGQRVSKTAAGVETDFVRDLDGTLLDTYVSGSYIGQPQEMWVAGRHYGTVTVSLNNGVKQQAEALSLTNWLGSEAMRSIAVASNGGNTGVPSSAFVSQPFGDGQTTLIGSDQDDIHFTGKERDAESGNDYFGARYYASGMGRWLSPDWSAKVEPVPYSKLDNPQTLNLYSYVTNNPLTRIDADGHAPLSWGGFENCGSENAQPGCGGNPIENQENRMAAQANIAAAKVWEQKSPAKYTTLQQAQVAGALAAFHGMVNSGIHQEWGDRAYKTPDGKFSYTRPGVIGPPCAEDAAQCNGEITANVPKGTTLEGDQHSHPWVGDDHQFDGDVRFMQDEGLKFYGYVAGPSSNASSTWGSNPNVFRIDPNEPSVCKVSGPSSISSCN
jgi:RHS repeat-associated protein